jgi:hypothetical protein
MKRIDAHQNCRTATYKDVSGYKAAYKDAQDIFDLRARQSARWDYASPAVLSEIEEYVGAMLEARR